MADEEEEDDDDDDDDVAEGLRCEAPVEKTPSIRICLPRCEGEAIMPALVRTGAPL